MMTAPATAEETSSKAPIAWSAITVALAGYLWGLLAEHALSLVGLLAFLVVTVVVFLGLRTPGSAKVVPIASFVGVLVAIVAALLAL